MAVTVSNLQRVSEGNKFKILGKLIFDSSYPTGGESLSASTIGLTYIDAFEVTNDEGGYSFESTVAAAKTSVTLKAYTGGVSAFTPAGTNSVPTYTDSATSGALNLATPLFSGTGLTAAGQAITTTDNQTMTLNQCAGMWLMAATVTAAPLLIVSNTAVTGAPAVLTVKGTAATDAGAYKIVKNLSVGTISAPTFTGTAVSGAVASEVANTTNLSALSAVEFEAIGQ